MGQCITMAGRIQVQNLIKSVASTCRCPAHSQAFSGPLYVGPGQNGRSLQTTTEPTYDYAFEMACSNIRYGPGVTKEVGMDLVNLKAKHVGVYTDKNLMKLGPMKATLDSLTKAGVNFTVYDDVRVEPTDVSFKAAADFAKANKFDAILAVGGGSVIDTAKAANLYASDPEADFLDYVNAPIGKGKPVTVPLMPLLAIPTTAGTGSETTGVAVFDYEPLGAKTGIANRALRPLLGLVDPLHVLSMPERVTAFSGFDVLCHALESYTARHYTERSPMPTNPINRPAYQGSNPISDVWSKYSLGIIQKFFKRAVYNQDDFEARSQMHLASTFAGIGFGNAGVPLCPERHLDAAELLGSEVRNPKKADAGKITADVMRNYMEDMKIPDGLESLNFTKDDIGTLVKGALPQDRVNKLAPRLQTEEDLTALYENSLRVY